MTEWMRCPKCDAVMIAITSGNICPLCGYRVPVQTITNTTGTSAEYVQVIRCKDCVYDHRCTHEMAMRRIPGGALIYCPVEYCSEGKRKEHAID